MTKRDVVMLALDGKKPPYIPWSLSFTIEAKEKLQTYYQIQNLDKILNNHFCALGNGNARFENIGNNRVKDFFGVIWNRSEDKDIGMVEGFVLPEPSLKNYSFPNPLDERIFEDIEKNINQNKDCFRVFSIGFSLYERAWTLRGIENLMMDFYDNPNFVKTLFSAITDYNIAQFTEALKYDIDAVHFGDDWGQQKGLQMGPKIWHEFIYPELKRMYSIIKKAGKKISIHSCGDVDELFDSLIDIGLNCFNPFQPEVMNVPYLIKKYHKKLAFHGGLSTQKTLPYGTVEDVIAETEHLLQLGTNGGYIFSPAHDVEGDVPVENMVAFINTLHKQPNVNF